MNFDGQIRFGIPEMSRHSFTGFSLPNIPVLKDQDYFTIVGPGTLRSNSKYNLAIAIHKAKESCEMRITIKGSSFGITKTLQIPPMSLQNLEFDIPKLQEGDYQIIAEGLSGIIFKQTSKLNFMDNSPLTLIQTDKATYKPGDLIQFRVLFMDDCTRPVEPSETILIVIKDGEGNLLKQWKDIKLMKGVFSGKYQLSEQPILGDWLINASIDGRSLQTKGFEVAKYVLPKFNVAIETAKNVAICDKIINITVRSKYTYGKAVKGKAIVTIRPSYPILIEKTIDVDGKGLVEFKLSDDLLTSIKPIDSPPSLMVSVEMEEELTGNKQEANETIQLHRARYILRAIDFPNLYYAGEPLCFKVVVENIDGTPVIDRQNSVKLVFNTIGGFGNSLFSGQSLLELTANLDEHGIATFNHCFTENAADNYYIRCIYLDCNQQLKELRKGLQGLKTKQLLNVKLLTKNLCLGDLIQVEISSSNDIPYFVYTIVGRGKLLKSAILTLPENTKEYKLEFKATFDMLPKVEVFIHYVLDDKLVFKELRIPIKREFVNKISLTSPAEAKLSEDVELQIKTSPGSYVGLLGVDQSVLILKSGNDLNEQQAFDGLEKFSTSSPKNFSYGSYPGLTSGLLTLTNIPSAKPDQLHTTFGSQMATGSVLFGSACSTAFGGPVHPYIGSLQNNVIDAKKIKLEPVIKIRKEFPENWFFDDIECTKGDIASFHKKVPDTITSWVITAFSMNPENGLAITENPTTIKTFRPFFISTNLPYSIKRGEQFSIPVILFNYTNEDVEAEITLDNSDNEFDFIEPGDNETIRMKKVRVTANNGGSVQFPICPRHLGQITLKIKALSPLAGDAIYKKLKVEPEGITIYKNQEYYLHAEGGELNVEKCLKLDIPTHNVPDSEFIEVSVMGSVLSSTITNLDKLVRMPYGCGEQNMVNFVPNIMVLWYLESIGELCPAVESKAKRFMEIGYQRELSYKHDDGSFSAFGKSDRSGSTWLTAYVVRSFHQAKQYIDISSSILEQSLNFLAMKQASDGSFPEVGKVIDFSHLSNIGLTAFVLLAFLENEEYINIHQKVIDRGFEYLQNNVESTEDIYALSLALYALHQRKSDAVNDLLKKLDSKAITDQGHKWWTESANQKTIKRSWYSRSHDVEITGYILMTMLEMNLPILPIMKWLISQRNSNGGFNSTQETVVGLWALIKFAEKSGVNNPNINVEIIPTIPELSTRKLNVDKDNALVLQSVDLPKQTRELKFNAKGTGVAILQVSYRYNIVEKEKKPSFKLSTTVKPKKSAKLFDLDIVTEFVPIGVEKSSNMVIMEVSLPSGYAAVTENITKIQDIAGVKRVETKDDNTIVIIYFDSLEAFKPKCIPIEAELLHGITGQKPVPIVVYDYYDGEKRATDFYQVENSLGDL